MTPASIVATARATIVILVCALGCGEETAAPVEPSAEPAPATLEPIAAPTAPPPDTAPPRPARWEILRDFSEDGVGLGVVFARGDELFVGGTGLILRHDGETWTTHSDVLGPELSPTRQIGVSVIVADGADVLFVGSRATIVRFHDGVFTLEHQNRSLSARASMFPWVTRCADEVFVRNAAVTLRRMEDGTWSEVSASGLPCEEPPPPPNCQNPYRNHRSTRSVSCRNHPRHYLYWAARSRWVEFEPGARYEGPLSAFGDEDAFYVGGSTRPVVQRYDGSEWTVEALPVDAVAVSLHGDDQRIVAAAGSAVLVRGRGPLESQPSSTLSR